MVPTQDRLCIQGQKENNVSKKKLVLSFYPTTILLAIHTLFNNRMCAIKPAQKLSICFS